MRGRRSTLEGVAVYRARPASQRRFDQRGASFVVGNVALARVREQRQNRGNSPGGGGLAGRDGDQEFDEMVVDFPTTGLDNVDVLSTDGLLDFNPRLAHGEFRKKDLGRRNSEKIAYCLGEAGVGGAPYNNDIPDHVRRWGARSKRVMMVVVVMRR